MSRSKVVTLTDLKNRDNNIILSSDHYTDITNQLIDLNEKLSQQKEDSVVDEIEIDLLKADVDVLTNIARNFKTLIKDEKLKKEANDLNVKMLKEKFEKIEITLKNKIINNSKRTKEELTSIAIKRNSIIKDKYKDLLDG
jgi:phosphoribosyl-dephospho-CoA transferase